jgi:hypothetical protein
MNEEKRGPDAAEEDSHGDPRHNNAYVYEIRVQGHLGDHWCTWFDGLTLTHKQDGMTVLAGPVVDQAELHGILAKICDLGLPLISVVCVECG